MFRFIASFIAQDNIGLKYVAAGLLAAIVHRHKVLQNILQSNADELPGVASLIKDLSSPSEHQELNALYWQGRKGMLHLFLTLPKVLCMTV